MFLFWITPVFYEREMLPESFQWITNFNPLSIYISLFRKILLEGGIPEVKLIFSALGWSFFSFLLGYSFFSKTESSFIKRL
jgi:ABC-type polysaccharide/polyol phosphate export permease